MAQLGRLGAAEMIKRHGRGHLSLLGQRGGAGRAEKYSHEVIMAIGRHGALKTAARSQLDRYFDRLDIRVDEEPAERRTGDIDDGEG